MSEKTKRKIISESHTGGLESLLDVLAILSFVFSVLVGIGFLIELEGAGIFLFLVIAAAGVLPYALLKAVAEMVRLLKKLNGLQYGGEISKHTTDKTYGCGACGEPIFQWGQCGSCGVEIEKDDLV